MKRNINANFLRYFQISSFLAILSFNFCYGTLEICDTEEKDNPIYAFLYEACKWGVLFNKPVQFSCIKSSDNV